MQGDSLLRLREETRHHHTDMEEILMDLVSPNLTRTAYAQRISQFYGFYQPLEVGLSDFTSSHGSPPAIDLSGRLKTGWLEEDLENLGVRNLTNLPLCPSLPWIVNYGSVMGILYVTEGATLGGQVLSRSLLQNLGINPDEGGRFFQGYGQETPRFWQTYRQACQAFVTAAPTEEDQVVHAAKATYESLAAWLVLERGMS